MNKNTIMLDMYHVAEDERITLIGNTAMRDGIVVFMVDSDYTSPGKADRYMRKLIERFPRLCEISREINVPVENATTIKVRLKDAN